MALRLIEVFAPTEYIDSVKSFLGERSKLEVWTDHLSEDRSLVRVLLPAEETEGVIDVLEKRFSNVDGFRLILLPVEATIPRLEAGAKPDSKEEDGGGEVKPKPSLRISREELYEDISEGAKLTGPYLAMVILSSVVASVGLMRNNPAVIIGAMVIAPLLGPSMGASLATALGDFALARTALKASASGVLVAFAFAVVLGVVFGGDVNPDLPEILTRTDVNLGDIVLALASGAAGALAFTAGFATTLVGVMVAVALLPPLVTGGLLLGSGSWEPALSALLLFFINLICINLAGVVTFTVRGIRPKRWYDAQKARKATLRALAIWIALLAALAVVVLLSKAT